MTAVRLILVSPQQLGAPRAPQFAHKSTRGSASAPGGVLATAAAAACFRKASVRRRSGLECSSHGHDVLGSMDVSGGSGAVILGAANNCVPAPAPSMMAASMAAAGVAAGEARLAASSTWDAPSTTTSPAAAAASPPSLSPVAGATLGTSPAVAAALATAATVPNPLILDPAAASMGLPPSATSSYGEEDSGATAAAAIAAGLVLPGAVQSEIDQAVSAAMHSAVEQEIENINQAVHEALEQEMEQVNLGINQTVLEAVENALLDRSFDIKANLNTMIALTGVILYWRGIWNIFDTWLGTDNFEANLGSVLIGLSVMLLFRIFKLPLAEFW